MVISSLRSGMIDQDGFATNIDPVVLSNPTIPSVSILATRDHERKGPATRAKTRFDRGIPRDEHTRGHP